MEPRRIKNNLNILVFLRTIMAVPNGCVPVALPANTGMLALGLFATGLREVIKRLQACDQTLYRGDFIS
jgi:uncharacterized membrane protein YadS